MSNIKSEQMQPINILIPRRVYVALKKYSVDSQKPLYVSVGMILSEAMSQKGYLAPSELGIPVSQ